MKNTLPTDDEFERFLRGEDELAGLLQQMPQPAPSAELDARILADAEAALRASTAAQPAAADKVAQAATHTSASPRPLSRRQWPKFIGVAASLIVVVGIAFEALDSGHFAPHTPSVYAPASDAEPPAAEMPAAAPAAAPSPAPKVMQAAPAADVPAPAELKVAPPKPTAPAPQISRAEPRTHAAESREAAQGAVAAPLPPAAPMAAPASTPIAEQAVKQAAPSDHALDKATDAHANMAPARVEMPAPAMPAAKASTSDASVADQPVNQHEVSGPTVARKAVNQESISPPPAAVAAPPSLPAPVMAAPRPMPAPVPAPVAQPAPAAAYRAFPQANNEAAKAALDHITTLLDQGDQAGALREWQQFQRNYPNYTVPEALKQRISQLQ